MMRFSTHINIQSMEKRNKLATELNKLLKKKKILNLPNDLFRKSPQPSLQKNEMSCTIS